MTVVVTGSTGHIGANLVRALVDRGESVRALVHGNARALDGLPVEIVHGDVEDPESLRRAFEGAQRLYHLAAVISIDGDRDGRVHRVNVVGAGNVARIARQSGIERMVHWSSVHAFDHLTSRHIDETQPRVRGREAFAYDRSKAAGEDAVRREIQAGLEVVVVHPSGVIGPHDYRGSRMGRVLLQLARGTFPALTPGAYDFVDVRDVVDGGIAAMERGRVGESYLLTGHAVALRELAGRVAALTGGRAPRLTVPMSVALAFAPIGTRAARLLGTEPLFTRESLAVVNSGVRFDHGKASAELGYRPRPLDDTLADTLRWFVQTGQLAPRRATG